MFGADYGGSNDIYGNQAHPDCGYATMVGIYVDSMDKTGQTVNTPTSGYTPVRNSARNTPITSGGITVTSAFSFPGWFSGPTGADPSIKDRLGNTAADYAAGACAIGPFPELAELLSGGRPLQPMEV